MSQEAEIPRVRKQLFPLHFLKVVLTLICIDFYCNKMKFKSLLLFLFIFSQMGMGNAQTVLMPGDVAFLGIQSGFTATPTPKDRFAFILLKAIDANTEIMFNDNSILQASPLRLCKNESLVKWKHEAPLNAGTVIVITEGDTVATYGKVTGAVALSQSGDQIFCTQANGADTSLIAGISITAWEANCVASCGGASNNVSCLPAPLNSTNALSLNTGLNNGFFNPTQLNGTPEEILAQVNNPSNWTLSDDEQTWNASTWQANVIVGVKRSMTQQNELVLSPNPTSGILHLATNHEYKSIRISNALGLSILETDSKNLKEFNLTRYPSGLYFVQLINAEGKSVAIKRVVKR